MAVKLRLMRVGKKKQPSYRVVAADSRSPRDGRFIEIVGFYNPRTDPSTIDIDNDKAVHWLTNGAKPTERVQKLLTISGAWSQFTGEAAPTPYVAPSPSTTGKPARVPEAAAADDASAPADDDHAEDVADSADAAASGEEE